LSTISEFQFPLHRDPRCNMNQVMNKMKTPGFQFPLHRDPRCNLSTCWKVVRLTCFSSLYIGILAATQCTKAIRMSRVVSVPFTSGSSLQHCVIVVPLCMSAVSVPFTSGSSLQQVFHLLRWPHIFVSVPFTSGSSLQRKVHFY